MSLWNWHTYFHSPGLNNREWIETTSNILRCERCVYSPGLNNREWIETANTTAITTTASILPV